MVNADKHRKLLNDYETRLRKKIVRQQLLSNNSQKKEKLGNHYLYSQGGTAGRNSIVETEAKRDKANKEFLQDLRKMEANHFRSNTNNSWE